MRHQWKFAQIEGNLQQLQLLTLDDPDINIELTMVSDYGGDYMAVLVLGRADFYECTPLNK